MFVLKSIVLNNNENLIVYLKKSFVSSKCLIGNNYSLRQSEILVIYGQTAYRSNRINTNHKVNAIYILFITLFWLDFVFIFQKNILEFHYFYSFFFQTPRRTPWLNLNFKLNIFILNFCFEKVDSYLSSSPGTCSNYLIGFLSLEKLKKSFTMFHPPYYPFGIVKAC